MLSAIAGRDRWGPAPLPRTRSVKGASEQPASLSQIHDQIEPKKGSRCGRCRACAARAAFGGWFTQWAAIAVLSVSVQMERGVLGIITDDSGKPETEIAQYLQKGKENACD